MTDIVINPSHFFMKLIFLHIHLKDAWAGKTGGEGMSGDNDQS